MIVKEEETNGVACTLVRKSPGSSQNGFSMDTTSSVSLMFLKAIQITHLHETCDNTVKLVSALRGLYGTLLPAFTLTIHRA